MADHPDPEPSPMPMPAPQPAQPESLPPGVPPPPQPAPEADTDTTADPDPDTESGNRGQKSGTGGQDPGPESGPVARPLAPPPGSIPPPEPGPDATPRPPTAGEPEAVRDEPGRRVYYGSKPLAKLVAAVVLLAFMVALLIYFQGPLLSLGMLLVVVVVVISLGNNTFVERRNPVEAMFTSGVVGFQRLVGFKLGEATLLDVVMSGEVCELYVRQGDGFDKRLLAGTRSGPVVSFAVRAAAALGVRVRIDPALGPADRRL